MSVFAVGTGLGPWPGDSPREAARVVVGELGDALPFLPQLPDRGVGADAIGRTGAVLVDIALELTPRGYRIVARPGAVHRRAASLLAEDLDALEEAWETAGLRGAGRAVKLQATGPVSLAAQLELTNGRRAVSDAGATRDLADSLAEGLATHRAEVARRLDAETVVQLDEPSLHQAIEGSLPGASAVEPVAALDAATAAELLDRCLTGSEPTLVRCDRPGSAWEALRRSAAQAVAVTVPGPAAWRRGLIGFDWAAADYDALAEWLDRGRDAVLGLIPAATPRRRLAVEEVAGAVAALGDRLGLARSLLTDRVGIAPGGGLDEADVAWARDALGLARRVAEALGQDPESI